MKICKLLVIFLSIFYIYNLYLNYLGIYHQGLEIFNLITRMTYTYNSSLVKLGVSRFIISKLEEEATTKLIGITCLNVLRNIGAFSKEALILMNNQSI